MVGGHKSPPNVDVHQWVRDPMKPYTPVHRHMTQHNSQRICMSICPSCYLLMIAVGGAVGFFSGILLFSKPSNAQGKQPAWNES